ncbi:MAG: hypothetical protein GX285_07250 [Clostridiales bacterium]|nr:hypothetical protein [Clostridiales bacterium]
MKRFSVLLIILLLVSLVLFGCANEKPQDGNENQPPPNTEGAIDDQNNQGETDQAKEIEGTFTGWIDNNSFEIMAGNEPLAIRATPDLISSDDALEGKKVRITYTTNEQGQNILESIELLD